MNTRFLKFGFLSLILILTIQTTQSQSLSRTAYFMENSTNRHLLNPALTSAYSYFSLPVVGAFSLGIESNMSFTDFIYPALNAGEKPRSFLDRSVDATDFLSHINPNNFFRMDMRTSLLSFGFYTGTGFWTFDVSSRVDMNLNLPKDLFAFAKLGMAHTTGDEYHLGNLSVGAGLFSEIALGYSQNLSGNLRVGAKVKYLGGIANVKAKIEQMDIEMRPEVWTVTTRGQMDVYGGFTLQKDIEGTITGASFDSPGLGGQGMALDLGVNYSPVRHLNLSLGIVDLGGIKWKKANILSAGSSGTTSFTGLSGITADSTNSESMDKQLEKLKNDLTTMADFKEKPVSNDFFQKLSPTMNAGVEYSMLKNRLSLGALYSVRMMENENYSELTTSLNLRPASWFNISGSYSYLHGEMETFGFALGFVPGIVNLFIACDYAFLKYNPQYIPLNTLTTNFQIGASIPLGRVHLQDKHE